MPESPNGSGSADYETALTKADRLDLRTSLRVLTCTNMIEAHMRRRLRDAYGITLPRFDLMAQLDRVPDGVTMGELSRRLMVSNGNVTGLIDRLVSEGLVERNPAPEDRRAQLVRLTPRGKKSFDAIAPEHLKWIQQLFSGLDRKDMEALYALLGKLKLSLAQGGQAVDTKEGGKK